jgi:hypothetical protein
LLHVNWLVRVTICKWPRKVLVLHDLLANADRKFNDEREDALVQHLQERDTVDPPVVVHSGLEYRVGRVEVFFSVSLDRWIG